MSDKLESIILIVTIALTVVVSALDFSGALDSIPWLAGKTSAMTLLFVGMLATYLIMERRGKLQRIEDSIVESRRIILDSLAGVETKLLSSTDSALDYMAEHILKAERQIDHVALAPPIPRRDPSSDRWEQAITKVLKGNKVHYRYVASLSDSARLQRVRKHLSYPQIQKYFVGSYPVTDQTIPALSFIIIDQQELILHYPFERGQSETFLSIRHPSVLQLFSAYYERLWAGSKHLTSASFNDDA